MIRSAPGLTLLLLILCFPATGQGFYEYQEQGFSLEIDGFVRAGLGQLNYPDDSTLYEVVDDQAWAGDFRLLVEVSNNNDLHLSTNILQSCWSKVPFSTSVSPFIPIDVERSSLLTIEQHDSGRSRAELLVDDLHLQYRASRFDLAVGRQPINLATTFYFVPNDFFAPFAPQTFFRTYKPGVDAMRADLRLTNLAQLTALGVLAYTPDDSTSNNWSHDPDWSETSLLIRASQEMANFELALLLGTIDSNTITGGSLQGEIFNQIGLRTEGHYSNPETFDGKSHYKLAVGLEKTYSNNFNWRLEYFHNGDNSSTDLFGLLTTTSPKRDYGALGLGYELTPLLNGNFLALAGFNDDSGLISTNILYSLSDESEMSLTFSIPFGDHSDLATIGSEFGAQPQTILFEYRLYL